MNPSNLPFVSVIIPVYNDAERLWLCLTALEQQTYPQSCYEVIVIDNGSAVEQNIKPLVAQFKQATAIEELTPGSYAARNRGIAIAQGEVIAFTDADCIPAQNWIENGVKTLFSTQNCGLVAGKIELFFKDPTQLTLVERYEKIMAFQQKEHLQEYCYGSTANVFTFRRVIDHVGKFDASLKSNGDFEWGRRVSAAGYVQVYAEEAVIRHPARRSWADLFKRQVRLAGGIYDAQIQKCEPWINRNKLFIRSVGEDFLSPILSIAEVFRYPQLESANQKFEFYLITLLVRYIRGAEKVRLKFGGVSSRG